MRSFLTFLSFLIALQGHAFLDCTQRLHVFAEFHQLNTDQKINYLARRGKDYADVLSSGTSEEYAAMKLEDGQILGDISLAERLSLMRRAMQMQEAGDSQGALVVEAVNHGSKGRYTDKSLTKEQKIAAIKDHIVVSYYYHYDKAVAHEKYRTESGTKELRPSDLMTFRSEIIGHNPELKKYLEARYAESTMKKALGSKKPEPMDRVILDWFIDQPDP